MNDLITLADWDAERLNAVLDLADGMKRDPDGWRSTLDRRSVILLFEKPSLRTRTAFEVGIARLGGHAIYFDHGKSRIGERESIKDYAKNLERWVDCIVARVFDHTTIERLAEHASIPVVNALSAREHPCQALADLMTLRERRSSLEGARLCFIGAWNNVGAALALACAHLGVNLTVVSPQRFGPAEDDLAPARAIAGGTGAALAVSDDPGDVEGHDAVYTDVWASMGEESEAALRRQTLTPYRVNQALMDRAGPNALFMHCLPAQRGNEVTDEVIDSDRSIVYDQAENRLHTQNALLTMLLRS